MQSEKWTASREGLVDDSQIELLTKKERTLEAEIVRLQDEGMTAQAANKQADLDAVRAELQRHYRETW
jgi:hypothetical protein